MDGQLYKLKFFNKSYLSREYYDWDKMGVYSKNSKIFQKFRHILR